MPVVMLLAVATVLVSVFFVATGWGGEMSYERPDQAPLDLGPVSATDVALLRPPTALWGYNIQATDEALEHIARAVRDRDVTIASLQQQLAELGYQEARPAQATLALPEAEETAESHPSSEVRLPPYLRQPAEPRQPPEPRQSPEPRQPAESWSPTEPSQSVDRGPRLEADGPASEPPPDIVSFSPSEPPPALESPYSPQDSPHETRPVTDVPTARNFLRATQAAPAVTQAAVTPPHPQPLSAPAAVTQPAAVTRVSGTAEPAGPQGSYDAHGWWAEQHRAAREELAADDSASDVDPIAPGSEHLTPPADDETLAAAEEQSW